jgi:hypothetical protein
VFTVLTADMLPVATRAVPVLLGCASPPRAATRSCRLLGRVAMFAAGSRDEAKPSPSPNARSAPPSA